MAHFAELDLNNVVLRVVVVDNLMLIDDGQESEAKGIAFCENLFSGRWVQTSYNGNIRKNYAGIGYTYDANRDAFIPPKPYISWALNETTCLWDSPIPTPTDDKPYRWDESTTSWVEVTNA